MPSSQLPAQILVEFALPLSLFFYLLFAFPHAVLFPRLVFGPSFAQNVGEPASYVPVSYTHLTLPTSDLV